MAIRAPDGANKPRTVFEVCYSRGVEGKYDPKQATTGYSFHKKNFTIGFLPWRLYRNSPKKARKQCDVNSTVLHLDIYLVVGGA